MKKKIPTILIILLVFFLFKNTAFANSDISVSVQEVENSVGTNTELDITGLSSVLTEVCYNDTNPTMINGGEHSELKVYNSSSTGLNLEGNGTDYSSANEDIPYGTYKIIDWSRTTGTWTSNCSDVPNNDGGETYTYTYSNPITTSEIDSQETPTSGSTVPYNVNFTGEYTNLSTYDHICANFTTTDASVAPYCAPIALENGTGLPYNFNYSLTPNHTYTYTLQLYDSTNDLYTTPTTAITFSTNALSTTTTTSAFTPEACDWTSPSTYGGCIDNIFVGLFYPSSDSINQFQNLYTQYSTKPPFGYILAIQTTLKSVNDTNTSVFTLQSLPILNTYIFNPLRTAFEWILWVGFTFLLFKRFQDIQL
jgi:hypothetical protein